MPLPRRVYRRELCESLGYSTRWFRILQAQGVIPKGQRDHPAGREWFDEPQAADIIRNINARARAAA